MKHLYFVGFVMFAEVMRFLRISVCYARQPKMPYYTAVPSVGVT